MKRKQEIKKVSTAYFILTAFALAMGLLIIQNEFTKLRIFMVKTSEELKAEFAALFTDIKDSIANVAADIDRLADSVDPAGGLTEAEAEELLSELRGISATAKATADKTPEEPIEPPTE